MHSNQKTVCGTDCFTFWQTAAASFVPFPGFCAKPIPDVCADERSPDFEKNTPQV